MLPLKPKHRRAIRDLLRILYDDKAWQPVHTDQLLDIVRAARTDVAEEVESTVARDAATARQLQATRQNEHRIAMREVDHFREAIKDLHAKTYAVLEALIDLPMMAARVKDDDGNWVIDPTLIDVKQAKVALSAIDKIAKISGAMAPAKVEIATHQGSAFELLDAIEVGEAK